MMGDIVVYDYSITPLYLRPPHTNLFPFPL